jgi:ankyrin repeat protein
LKEGHVKIHDYANRGDHEGIAREAKRPGAVDDHDREGRTPLMVAAASRRATPETLRLLLSLGANVNALTRPTSPPTFDESELTVARDLGLDTSILEDAHKCVSVDSVLGHAVVHASLEKIDVLLEAGADARYVDPCGYGILVHSLRRNLGDSPEALRRLAERLIDAGAPLDAVSAYGESALSVAAMSGRFGLVRLMLDHGQNPARLGWNELFIAVAFDSVSAVKKLLTNPEVLHQRDRWERTPFLVAVHAGRKDMAGFLLSQGSDFRAKGHCGQTALMEAISVDDPGMAKWLIERGADLEEPDEFGTFPLMMAAQYGAARTLRVLLESGADAGRCDQTGANAMSLAVTPEVAKVLTDYGASWSDVESELRRELLGHAELSDTDLSEFSDPRYFQFWHRQFGKRNPQSMNNPFWDAMVRTRESAYTAAQAAGQPDFNRPPVWCFQRFGQTLTRLSDGRFVEIGGEHEDYYDPHFCIYNDVVVHHGDGSFTIYGYPESLFPPTDFHTATLVDSYIYIIGCLGYSAQRRPGFTPVYRLNLESFAIEPVECRGPRPGWIHDHRAALVDGGEIEVTGGQIQDEDGLQPSDTRYLLDVARRTWRLG